eukprot:CAMPEP_0194259526 /NCGR_PEP_ID=MMETSP0158-20130606/43786_1 /TAXON_ID=33649 /ORGANISM="Thalassionema nitzschioides, Strain L26-B" /LENGTH=223 /DNA_ID=CAMNT_0038999353 /DNA_START=58 /DNA_END=729 /DNA_ORIENTATION=+
MSAAKRRKIEGTNGRSRSNMGSEDGNTIGGDSYDGYESLSMEDIQIRIKELCHRVPRLPEAGLDSEDDTIIKEWATSLQAVIEEFNLLACCVSPATYKWGSERSGAADQNLNVLSAELASSQDQISSTVMPRLTNVLAPVVDLVIEKVITTKDEDGKEIRQNIFTRKQTDPDFVHLCCQILCRNAKLLRQVVLSNFIKIQRCIDDYRQACLKDSQHDSRGFAY